MAKAIIRNDLPIFQKILFRAMDDAVQEGARDVVVKAKNKAPFLKGGLRSSAYTERVAPMHQRISFNIEYAGYQEAGQRADGTHRVRRYSTPGTGAHFLQKAGDEEMLRLGYTFRKHTTRVRI